MTLKAGSKVYDGNSNSFSITSDITKSGLTGGDVQQILLLKTDGTTLISVGVSDTTFAYNSSTGYVHSNTYGDYYLPIALTSHNTGTGAYTSIDQIFNGFGYIGSTVFALPGVVLQQADGKNADGSNKTMIQTISSVLTNTLSSSTVSNNTYNVYYHKTSASPFALRNYGKLYYNANTNLIDDTEYPSATRGIVLLTIDTDSNARITTFKMIDVDSVANSNMSNISSAGRSFISGLGKPKRNIQLTLGASGSTYIAPANGWFRVTANPNQNTYGRLHTSTLAPCFSNVSSGAIDIEIYAPVSKGEVVTYTYSGSFYNTNRIQFIYDEGE